MLAVSKVMPLLLVLLLIAGCGGGKRDDRRASVKPPETGRGCLAALEASGAEFEIWAPGPPGRAACRIDQPVALKATGVRFDPPLRTSCPMALAWTRFEPAILEAARVRTGSDLASIQHYGSYACRSMTSNAGRLSLHARAEAIDISGMTLADGRTISVRRDWSARNDKSRFLRAFRDAACARFAVVLTPNSDAAHRDHIHIDIGPWRLCEA